MFHLPAPPGAALLFSFGLFFWLAALLRYQQAELINGRTAMTGVAGILIPGVGGKTLV